MAKAGISGGTWKLNMKLGFIPLPPFTGNICDSVTGGCPVQPGRRNATITIDLPGFAPAGRYDHNRGNVVLMAV